MLVGCFFSWTHLLPAQLVVGTMKDPVSLVWKQLIGANSGLKITNITYTGAPLSIGTFQTNASRISIKKGIILTTGTIYDAKGPNTHPGKGQDLHKKGDAQLSRLCNNLTLDASILEFDFVAQENTLEFQFVFASEEYPEFVNKGVNDVFGFFLTRISTKETINLARVPHTSDPVTVDQINAKKNSELYIQNGIWNPNDILKWEQQPELGEYAYTFQYDGLTQWLTASSTVIPGVKYHLKIAIADAGDGVFDSAVLLKSKSFVSRTGTAVKKQPVKKRLSDTYPNVKQSGDSTIVELRLQFEHDAYQIEDELELQQLLAIVDAMNEFSATQLLIVGHTDNTGTKDYNQQLSEQRADFIKQWMIKNGIPAHRIQHTGKGGSQPLNDNLTEAQRNANRRVEFILFEE